MDLKQNRLDGLQFNLGIFTNLSQDHLDYHKNLKEYLKAKLYLFENLIKKKVKSLQTEIYLNLKRLKKFVLIKI